MHLCTMTENKRLLYVLYIVSTTAHVTYQKIIIVYNTFITEITLNTRRLIS